MSSNLQPPPFQLGAMGSTDQDGSWLIDCTAWATARGVTLVSVDPDPIVRRKDGKDLDVGDVALSGVGVVVDTTIRNGVTVQAGYGFFFSATANGNSTKYDIGFELTDSADNVVTRWGELPVLAMLG